jgi:hypothetical protein
MSQASFAKRQREKERREKAAIKAARKAERREESDETTAETLAPGQEEALLAALAALHAKFDNDEIEYEEFEEAKQQLTSQLQI